MDAPSPPRNPSPEQDPCLPPDVPQGLQRAMTSILFIDLGQVLARITTSLTDNPSGIVNEIDIAWQVPFCPEEKHHKTMKTYEVNGQSSTTCYDSTLGDVNGGS